MESLLTAAVGDNANDLLSQIEDLKISISLIPNTDLSELLSYNLIENYTSSGFNSFAGATDENNLIVNVADGTNILAGSTYVL